MFLLFNPNKENIDLLVFNPEIYFKFNDVFYLGSIVV